MRDDFPSIPIRDSKGGGAAARVSRGLVAGAAAGIGTLAGCGVDGGDGGGVPGGVGFLNEVGDMLLGGDGNDRITNQGEARAIEAGGGDDTILGAAVAEAISAGPGDDMIDGGAGDDTIDGGPGDDAIDGGPGDDAIDGGAGDDMIIGGVGDDRIDGGASGGADPGGFDTAVYEGAWPGYRIGGERHSGEWAVFIVRDMEAGEGDLDEGEDELTGFEAVRFGSVTLPVVETGTDEGDILIGTSPAGDGSAEAPFDGGGGDDVIFGFGGGDTIAGGAGGDVVAGGEGDDTLFGHSAESNGEEEDVVDTAVFPGAPSGYRITAEQGDFGYRQAIRDVVRFTVMDIDSGGSDADEGTDTLVGFEALRFDEATSSTILRVTRSASDTAEILLGTDGADGLLDGMGGDDLIFGFAGNDVIAGGAGNDIISGGDGADTVTGGAGDDTLYGHGAAGDGDGTGGADTAVYADARAGYRISAVTTGSGVAVLSVRDVSTATGDEGTDTLTGFEALRFDDGTFRVAGSGSNDGEILVGTGGSEREGAALDGGDGDDTIFGFAGDDVIHGGDGDDIMTGGAGDDVIDGGGHDTADAAVYLGRHNGGTGSEYSFQTKRIHENGVAVNLLIVTDIGANNRAWDMVDEGEDTLRGVEFLNFADQTGVATSTLSTTLVEIIGDGMDNTLAGDTGDQRISGGGGADRIVGGGGNDTIDGGAGEDTAVFLGGRDAHNVTPESDGAGADSIVVRDGFGGSATLTNIESVEFSNTTLAVSGTGTGSDSNDIVFGSVGDDAVAGGPGGDLIFGFGGEDSIEGGAGDDVVDGGAGNDTAVYAGALRDFQFTTVNGALVVRDERDADGLDEGHDSLTNFETLRFGSGDVAVSDIFFATGNAAQMVGHATRNGVFYGEGGGHSFASFGGSDRFQFLTAMDSTSSSKTTIAGFDGGSGDRIALADIDGLRNLGAETMTDAGGTFTRLRHSGSGFELDVRGDHPDILGHVQYIGNKPIEESDAFLDNLPLISGSRERLPDLASWFEPGDPGETPSFAAVVDGTDINAAGIGLTLSTEGVLGGVFTGTSNVTVRVTVTHESGERAYGEFTISAVLSDLDGTTDGESLVDPTTIGRVINGLGGDDTLRGGRGDDTLHGGSAMVGVEIGTDNDAAVYEDDFEGYRVWAEWVTIGNTETARFTVRDIRGAGGDDEGEDTAVGIEEFRFGDGARRVVTAGNATEADEFVVGTNAPDSFGGDAGADLIFGFGGLDNLNGGPGDDLMAGGGGNDTLDGAEGWDIAVFLGGREDYTITEIRSAGGRIGHSVRDGDPARGGFDGTDNLVNVEALRFLGDDAAADTTDISSVRLDIIRGSSGPDTIVGGAGTQTITGDAGADTIAGGAGDDRIYGHLADDHSASENEIDTAVFLGQATSYSVTAELGGESPELNGVATFKVQDIDGEANGGDDGRDTAVGFEAFRFGSDTLAVVRADRTSGHGANEIIVGSMGEDSGATGIEGGMGDDLIFGFGGADTISGGEGGDTIMGGDGNDTVEGGAGTMDTAVHRGDRNDYKITAFLPTDLNPARILVEDEMPMRHGNDGQDELTGVETLRFLGGASGTPTDILAEPATADVIMGSTGDDIITGGNGGQEIFGGGGNDTITGGNGVDVALFGAHIHGYNFTASSTRDAYTGISLQYRTVHTELGGTTRLNGIEKIRFGANEYTPRTFSITDDISGTDGNEILLGTDDPDTISSGAGDDVIFGFGGDDRLNGGSGNNEIHGGRGADIMRGGGGEDTIHVDTFTGNPDRIQFSNHFERFDVDLRERGVSVQDLGDSGSNNHEGGTTIQLAYDSSNDLLANGRIEFGNNKSYLTDDIHLELFLGEDKSYSERNDIIEIGSYSGHRTIMTGEGEDIIQIERFTDDVSEPNSAPMSITILDFEIGVDRIAIDPGLSPTTPYSGDGVAHRRDEGSVEIFKTGQFSIIIPNVPENFDFTELAYIIGQDPVSSASVRQTGRKEIPATVVAEEGFRTIADGEIIGETNVRKFDVDRDWTGPSNNPDGDSRPEIRHDPAPVEIETPGSAIGEFPVGEDHHYFGMF